MTVTDTDETQILTAAADLHRKGWEITLAPPGKKAPVVPGTTGDTHDKRLSLADIQTWVIMDGYATLGVVCPMGVIGIDVDDYTNPSGAVKRGGEAMAALKACAGQLPATWRTTSRRDPKSGIWFYRLPNGLTGRSSEGWPTGLADVEYIRHSHRWAITAPSLHARTGEPYRWEGPGGSTEAPSVDQLPTLTASHVAHLRGTCGCGAAGRSGAPTAAQGIDAAFTSTRTYESTEDAVATFWDAMHGAGTQARYEVMNSVVGRLVRDGATDPDLHAELREIYVEAVWKDRPGGRATAEGEYNRSGLGAIAKGFADDNRPTTPVERSVEAQAERFKMADRQLLRLHTLEQMAHLPPPQWYVENLVPDGGLTILYGPPGSYKSFLALSLALALDTGQDFIGHPVERTVRPLYVAGEGHSGLTVRSEAWHAYHGRPRAESGTLIQNGAVNLADYDHVGQLIDAINEHGIGFVIFDTLARCTLGVEENSASEMGVVIANMDTIRHETGAGVLAVHHSGKDPTAGGRGSSAIKGAADAELSVIAGQLRVEKMKDGPEIDPTSFRMVEPDAFIGSVVPISTSEMARPYEPEPDDEPTFGEDLAAIVEWLEHEGEARTIRAILREVPGRTTRLTQTVALAVGRGYLAERTGPRNSKLIGLPEWEL